jgi:hypothetical protein
MAARDDLARLRALAAQKGYRLDRAITRGRWRLIDEVTGDTAADETGSATFTVAEAIRFLRSREPNA